MHMHFLHMHTRCLLSSFEYIWVMERNVDLYAVICSSLACLSLSFVMILLSVCCSFFPPPLFCSPCAGCVCGRGCGWFLAAADEAHLISCSPNHPHNKSLVCAPLRCQIIPSCPTFCVPCRSASSSSRLGYPSQNNLAKNGPCQFFMAADTKEFVSACAVCARSKASHQAPAGLPRPLPIPHRPMSHIAVDFVTGLPPLEGNTVILTIVDRFLKAAHFIPLSKLPSAVETANLLVLHVFRIHGIPVDIVSDRGPKFSARAWKAFCQALGASVSLSLGYHPQTNGQIERANQDLGAALRCVTSRNPASWSTHLPWVEYAHNSLVCSATGMSPFMACNGFQPPLFPAQADVAVPSVQGHRRRARRVWRETRAALTRTTARNQRVADRHRTPAPDYQGRSKGLVSCLLFFLSPAPFLFSLCRLCVCVAGGVVGSSLQLTRRTWSHVHLIILTIKTWSAYHYAARLFRLVRPSVCLASLLHLRLVLDIRASQHPAASACICYFLQNKLFTLSHQSASALGPNLTTNPNNHLS